jgi:hypothetical protein
MLSIVALVLPLFHIWGLLTRGVPASIRSLVPREKLVKQITVHKRQFKEGLQRWSYPVRSIRRRWWTERR